VEAAVNRAVGKELEEMGRWREGLGQQEPEEEEEEQEEKEEKEKEKEEEKKDGEIDESDASGCFNVDTKGKFPYVNIYYR
jgi:DNA repair photolyase